MPAETPDEYFQAMGRRLRMHLRLEIENQRAWRFENQRQVHRRAASVRNAMDEPLARDLSDFLIGELPKFAAAFGYKKVVKRARQQEPENA